MFTFLCHLSWWPVNLVINIHIISGLSNWLQLQSDKIQDATTLDKKAEKISKTSFSSCLCHRPLINSFTISKQNFVWISVFFAKSSYDFITYTWRKIICFFVFPLVHSVSLVNSQRVSSSLVSITSLNTNIVFFSRHIRILEWIYTVKYQGILSSKQARYLKFKWLQRYLNPQLLSSLTHNHSTILLCP